MIPQTGTPPLDGWYVVYAEHDKIIQPFVTRAVAGTFRYRYSDAAYGDKIHGWIGPLPGLAKQTKPEFDL